MFETTAGGTWRLAGCWDYWSKYEHPFHVSPTGNQHDPIDAVELELADFEAMFGHPVLDLCEVDVETGQVLPVVTIVTDNGARSAPSASRRPSSCVPSWRTCGLE